MSSSRFFVALFCKSAFNKSLFLKVDLQISRLSDATPSPGDGAAVVLPLKRNSPGENQASKRRDAFEKMHKGEVVKSVIRPV